MTVVDVGFATGEGLPGTTGGVSVVAVPFTGGTPTVGKIAPLFC